MRSFIIGCLVGAGVALLYAPATGARTRSIIRDKATSLGNDVSDYAGKKSRHLANKMDGYRARMRRVTETMSDRMAAMGNRHAMEQEPTI